MFVLKNEGRRREKIRYMRVRGLARPCHYRHGPCQASGFCGCARHGQARPWHCRHGPCQASGIFGSIFFPVFLNLARTITYKTT